MQSVLFTHNILRSVIVIMTPPPQISNAVTQGISLVIAYTLLTPLFDDIQDSFGNAFLYHPFALWLCIITLVYTQTENWTAGTIVVAVYEATKYAWRKLNPEAPYIGQLRKLLHRLQQKDLKLSDNDIKFLNNITPEYVSVSRKT